MKISFRLLLSLVLFVGSSNLKAQSEDYLEKAFKTHITYLASDELAGRETGTPGEALAADYISQFWEKAGLSPGGTDGSWFQPFEFLAGKRLGPENYLKAGTKSFAAPADYFPLMASANGAAQGAAIDLGYGIQSPETGLDDYKGKQELKGKVFIIRLASPEGNNPHSKYAPHDKISNKVKKAKEMGAAAVILVNENEEVEEPEGRFSRRLKMSFELPVVFMKDTKAASLTGKEIQLGVQLEDEYTKGKNVIALIDNGAPFTLVMGAHYDHLGLGEEGSLHRGEPAIHNGADDNASGVALIMEASAWFKEYGSPGMNYQFIAFSGEEKGLLGSNYYSKNPTHPLEKVSCMFNFDMVGRLDPAENTLGVNGVGTSPFWKSTMESIELPFLTTKTSESGVGPSDHTSFYLKDIPVLHFFTGSHEDYHKPSDDEELINYPGMVSVYRYVMIIGNMVAEEGELEFTQTKNDENRSAPRFKVTLGVVPDYLFDGEGMKIDGVTEGKTASNAGMKSGDIVKALGPHGVKDMWSYMEALSKFEKGDKTTVTFLRDGKQKKKKIKF